MKKILLLAVALVMFGCSMVNGVVDNNFTSNFLGTVGNKDVHEMFFDDGVFCIIVSNHRGVGVSCDFE